MRRQLSQPSFTNGFARSRGESARPELWPDSAWVPAFGIQGSRVWDVGGRANHGTIGGSPTWTTGRNGTELLYATSSDRIIASALTLPPAAGTVIFWGRPNFASGAQKFFWDTTGGNGRRFLLWRTSSNNFELYTDSTSRGTVASGAMTGGQWYHFALVWGVNKLYRDGALFHTFTAGGLGNGASALHIGSNNNLNVSYEGSLGNFSVYHRALTDSEIMVLAADPLLPFRRRVNTPYKAAAAAPASSIGAIIHHRRLLGVA